VKFATEAIEKYAPERKDSLENVVSEFHSTDHSEGGWDDANNLGHSIVAFDLLGQLLTSTHTTYSMLWATRWL